MDFNEQAKKKSNTGDDARINEIIESIEVRPVLTLAERTAMRAALEKNLKELKALVPLIAQLDPDLANTVVPTFKAGKTSSRNTSSMKP